MNAIVQGKGEFTMLRERLLPKPRWRVRRVGHLALNTVLMAALMAAMFVGYGLIDNRWYRVVAVYGSSMAPAIEAGDALVMARPPARIEAGMVLVFEVGGSVVTHRVVSVELDGTFTTQGDANPAPDGWDPDEVNVIGRYAFRIPRLGRLLSAMPFSLSQQSAAFLTDVDSAAAEMSAEMEPGPAAEG